MSDKLAMLKEERPWYTEGLSFKCTGCGQCCTGGPGHVWVSLEEMRAIADHLRLPWEEFTSRYVRQVGSRYSLVEDPRSYDCAFLKGNQCSVYPVRPSQCRTFPWWPQNLASKEAWREAARHCEGIGNQAPVVPLEEIERNLETERKEEPSRWINTSLPNTSTSSVPAREG